MNEMNMELSEKLSRLQWLMHKHHLRTHTESGPVADPTREPSETDRRVMLIKLTEKGQNEQQKEWNPDTVFSCLSEEEQESFSKYLDRIIAAIEDELGEEADEHARDWWLHGGRDSDGERGFGDERGSDDKHSSCETLHNGEAQRQADTHPEEAHKTGRSSITGPSQTIYSRIAAILQAAGRYSYFVSYKTLASHREEQPKNTAERRRSRDLRDG